MDPFAKLAPEIRVEIIVHVELQTSIINLMRASPVMCSQYSVCKRIITRRLLTNMVSDILGKDLLQDALGILHFPSSGNASIRRHVTQWMARTIPDPFAQQLHDDDTISKLHGIFSRIIMFVEDYVSKATDPFPPRAYLALPPIVSGGDRLFKGQTVGIKSVPFNALTTSERRRLVGAFLKYEMICLVHKPRVWTILKGSRQADLVSEEDEKLLLTQLKELYSVRDTNVYLDDVNNTADREPAYILPSLGLGLLTKLLISFNAGGGYGQYLKTWLFACSREIGPYYRSWDLQGHFFSRYKESVAHDLALLFRGLPPESCRNHMAIIQRHNQFHWDEEYNPKAWVCQQKQHELQVRIYRQRAWGLFDNTRLYSNMEEHFPTMDDLEEQVASQPIGAFYERPRRRSQRWHDWYLGRSLESPLEKERERSLRGEAPRKQERVEDNHGCIGRFFEKQTPGKIPTFWRQNGVGKNE
ncbi:hypothetical protein FALBO_16637 [Fusarium albosuccineum]|uniref:Uncharacterized protein n=1 Tax=Fusarium albosuccineum TaxID=1237068 RepID=A0A8H4KG70_9HYPO|nr:hypothetical protein FALBO_16637 [Fusarium albosuccineum]